jgi:hypothetical protein
MATKNTAPANSSLPFYLGLSQCEDVYKGEQHYAIFSKPEFHIVADLELGMSEEAKAKGEFIVRACNSHHKLTGALENLLQQTVDMDLAHGIELTEGEKEARDKAITALKEAHENT